MKSFVPSAVRWSFIHCAALFLWIVTAVVLCETTPAFGSVQSADLHMVKTNSEGATLWSRTLGGPAWDYANAIRETQDGGYLLAGSTNSFGGGGQDILLVRMDVQGEVMWSAIYGGPADERAEGMVIGPEGDIILLGTTDSYGSGSGDLYLIKTDAKGEVIWSRTYGGTEDEMAGAVERTADGGFILVGTTRSFGAEKRDIYVVRTDPHGDRIWEKRHGSDAHDVAYGIKETMDGGYILVGSTQSTESGTWDLYLIRMDSQGEALWHRTWGDEGYEVGYSVIETEDLGYFVSGYKDPFGPEKWDVLLIRTDKQGQVLWNSTYGADGNERADALLQAENGALIIAGATDGSGSGGWDMVLLGIDGGGNEIWSHTYGGADTDGAECVIQTRDGGFLMAGGTYSFGNQRVNLDPSDRTSPPISGDVPPPPVLTVTQKGTRVTLAWTSAALAERYNLLYSPPDGSYVGRLDVGTGTLFSVDLWPGAAFYIAVEARDPAGATSMSNILYLRIE